MFVKRSGLSQTFASILKNPNTRLIHVHGIAGAGKTSFVVNELRARRIPFELFDSGLTRDLDPASMNRSLARMLLSPKYQKQVSAATEAPKPGDGARLSVKQNIRVQFNQKVELSGNSRINIGAFKQYRMSATEMRRLRQNENLSTMEALFALSDRWRSRIAAIVFDRFELVPEDNSEFDSWRRALLKATRSQHHVRLLVITVGRRERTVDPADDLAEILVESMSVDEADQLLKRRGVHDRRYRDYLLRLTRGHALSLRLAADVAKRKDLRTVESEGEIGQELVTKVLWEHILQNESDPVVRRALRELPIFRFFTASLVRRTLRISAHECGTVVQDLLDRGYVERTYGLLRWHDLLRQLTLDFVRGHEGEDQLRKLHSKAAKIFLSSVPEGLELVHYVEPFYHLFEVDPCSAQAYFEPRCKAALDRNDSLTSRALLQPVRFDRLAPGPIRGWYLLRLGGFYRQFMEFESALKIFDIALSECGTDLTLRASLLNNIGWCHLYIDGQPSSNAAKELFLKSNVLCRKLGLKNIEAMNLNNLGIAENRATGARTKKELSFYRKSLQITAGSDQWRNPLVAAMSHRNSGLVYADRKDFRRALKEFESALRLYREARDASGEGECLMFIGSLYRDAGHYEKARKLYDASFVLLRRVGHPRMIAEVLLHLAEVLQQLGDRASSRQCLRSACFVSTSAKWDYHESVVARVLRLAAFVGVRENLDEYKALLTDLRDSWRSNGPTEKLTAFPELMDTMLAGVEGVRFWTEGEGKLAHLIGAHCCTPMTPNVLLLDANVELPKCDKCAGHPPAVEQAKPSSGPANGDGDAQGPSAT